MLYVFLILLSSNAALAQYNYDKSCPEDIKGNRLNISAFAGVWYEFERNVKPGYRCVAYNYEPLPNNTMNIHYSGIHIEKNSTFELSRAYNVIYSEYTTKFVMQNARNEFVEWILESDYESYAISFAAKPYRNENCMFIAKVLTRLPQPSIDTIRNVQVILGDLNLYINFSYRLTDQYNCTVPKFPKYQYLP